MKDATILFGERGQPAATVAGDALFNADGKQIGFFEDELIFNVDDGGFMGSYVNGVVYNADGHAQGFRNGATPGIAMLAPGMTRLPPRVRSFGQNIRDEAPADIPDFLHSKLRAPNVR
jgi:hypothetical protein